MVQVDTSGFGGKKLEKIAEVMSNDPEAPIVNLKMFGQVEKFVTINPAALHLRGLAGEKIKGTVYIIPENKYPFQIMGVQSTGGKLKFVLTEVKEGSSNGYALSVENLALEAGSYNDTVILKTDSSIRPVLQVRVYIYLRPSPQLGNLKR